MDSRLPCMCPAVKTGSLIFQMFPQFMIVPSGNFCFNSTMDVSSGITNFAKFPGSNLIEESSTNLASVCNFHQDPGMIVWKKKLWPTKQLPKELGQSLECFMFMIEIGKFAEDYPTYNCWRVI